MRRPLLTVVFCSLLASPGQAAEPQNFMIDTAADLARLCGAAPQHANYMAAIHMCHGYLVGAHHFHVALQNSLGSPVYCLKTGADEPTRDDVAAAFTAWIAATPGAGEREAIDSLLLWASQTYPCN